MNYLFSDAYLSEDGKFRYFLYRKWQVTNRFCLWVMLNPSTADSNKDDPTIRKCVGFADRHDLKSIVVVNLFAYRATSPDDLKAANYPIGEKNDEIINKLASKASLIIAAWGAHAPKDRDYSMRKLLGKYGAVKCFGLTKQFVPRHPLMLSYSSELIDL